MKWVRCVYNGAYETLTIGKVYEVLSFGYPIFNNSNNKVSLSILNDLGVKSNWFEQIGDKVWFEDVTAEIRDNKINQVLL